MAVAAVAVAAASAAVGHGLAGLDLRIGPAALIGGLTAAVLLVLRSRHRVVVSGERLVVGRIGGFAVPLDTVQRWQVLGRGDALEVRAALRGAGRVALLPWVPAAVWLVLQDGRVYLVGTRRPDDLRAAIARAAPHAEASGDVVPALADVPGRDRPDGPELDVATADARATGGAAALLLVATAVFGALVSLLVLDAVSSLGLAVAGTVAGPAVGALVVVEAAARTPLPPVGAAALAAVCAGMAPPVAALLAGSPATGVVFLGAVTVPIAFAAATLHRGAARRA